MNTPADGRYRYRYHGTDKLGNPVRGRLDTLKLARWTEDRFKDGWRSLTVERDGLPYPIAGIRPSPVTGALVWYADGAE